MESLSIGSLERSSQKALKRFKMRGLFLPSFLFYIALILVPQSVLAQRDVFEFAGFPAINGVNECSGCHANVASEWDHDSPVLSGPTSIASSQTSVTISVTDLDPGATSFLWRYRVGTSGSIVYPATSAPSATVAVGSSGNPTIQFCIAEALGAADTEPRNLNCGSLTIPRDPPPNNAPSITSVAPSGPLNLVIGATQSVTVTASDDGPVSELDHTAVSSSSSIASVSGGGGGASETFVITAREAGTATITFRVRDLNSGAGNKTDTQTLTVNVSAPPNNAPSITSVNPSGNIALVEGNTQNVTVTASDDGPNNELDHTASSNNTSVATVSGGGSGASETFTITAQNAGTATITFRVRDLGSGAGNKTDTETVTVTVTEPPNGAPSITAVSPSGTINLVAGNTQSISVTATDDGPSSELDHSASSNNDSVASVSGGGGGASGAFTITANSAGTATITFRVRDRNSGSGNKTDTETVTVVVAAPPDDAPTITSVNPGGTINLAPGDTDQVQVSASDNGPANELVQSASSDNTSVATVSSGGTGANQTYTITAVADGTASITFVVRDNNGDSGSKQDAETVTVVVATANQPPQLSLSPSGTASINVGQTITLTATATDDSTTALNFSTNTNNASVVDVSGSDGNYTVEGLTEGDAVITVTVTDQDGASTTDTLTVTVSTVPNEAPVISAVSPAQSFTMVEGDTQSISLSVNDESPSTVNYSGSSANESVATLSSNGSGTFTITAVSPGNTDLTATVVDDGGLSVSSSISVTVVAGNNAPVAVDDQFVFDYQSTSELLDILANDSDADGDSLNIVLDNNLSSLGGELVLQEGQVSYTAPENLAAVDSFTYTVTDTSQAGSNTAMVTITPSDGDGDGFFDNADNCRILPNPAQANMDGDELGDACDPDPDGDGVLGEAARPFTTGKSLVEGVCLDCHREGVSGAPQFGDEEAWAARVEAAGGIEALLNSVTNGKGAMPAWGRIYTARELIQGLLYMTGLEDPLLSEGFFDSDLDGIDNLNDNCVNFANSDQADSNNNSVGDACEPDSNNDGILDYSLSMLVFQNTASGRQNGSIVRVADGPVTIAARTRAGLSGLSYDWSESSAGFLGLLTSGTNGESVTLDPSTVGVYDVVVSVSGNGVAATGRTRLSIVDLAAGVDLTDTDGDGYPAHLDDNNLSANRVLESDSSSSQSSVFFSENAISLGEFALYTASANNFESAGAVLSEQELLAAAQARFPDVTATTDDIVDTAIGVIDVEIRELDGSSTALVMKLRGNIPLAAQLKLYKPAQGIWEEFNSSSIDSIASAPKTGDDCPASSSGNFSTGLNAGQACVRIVMSDGGPNDIDAGRDGVVSVLGAVGSVQTVDNNNNGGVNEPEVVDLNPSQGGGGTLSPLEMLTVLLVFFLLLFANHQRVRSRTIDALSRRDE